VRQIVALFHHLEVCRRSYRRQPDVIPLSDSCNLHDIRTEIRATLQTQLTFPATDPWFDRDSVANLEVLDVGANLQDLPCGLVAENDIVRDAAISDPQIPVAFWIVRTTAGSPGKQQNGLQHGRYTSLVGRKGTVPLFARFYH
jgi:hypothetical protein